jgi:hypothetical protein
MNNTHGDLLYRPNTSSSPRPVGELGTPGPTGIPSHSSYQAPRGEVGWICPVCGRGLAPSTAYCNCKMTKLDIVYANDGLTVRSVLDDAIPCLKTNEYTAATANSTYITATNTSK